MKSTGFKRPVPQSVDAFVSGENVPHSPVQRPSTEEKWERLHVQIDADLYVWLQDTRAPKQSLAERTREILRAAKDA